MSAETDAGRSGRGRRDDGARPTWYRRPAFLASAVVVVLVLVAAGLLVARSSGSDVDCSKDPSAPGCVAEGWEPASAEDLAALPDLGCTLDGQAAPASKEQCSAAGHVAEDAVVVTDRRLDFAKLDRAGRSQVNWTGPDQPAVGELVVTTVGPDQDPFYGRVVAVDGTLVDTEPASLREVIPDLDLEVDLAAQSQVAVDQALADEFGPAEEDLPPVVEVGSSGGSGATPGDGAAVDPGADSGADDGSTGSTGTSGTPGSAVPGDGADQTGGTREGGLAPADPPPAALASAPASGPLASPAQEVGSSQSSGPSVTFGGKKNELTCSSGTAASIEVKPDVDMGQAQMRANWTVASGPSFDFSLHPTARLHAVAEVGLAGTCRLSTNLVTIDLPPFVAVLGVVPVKVDQELGIDLDAEVEVGAKATAELDVVAEASVGVRYTGGRLQPYATAKATRALAPPAAGVKVRATVATPVYYEAALAGAFSAKPALAQSLTATFTPFGDPVFTLDAALKASMSVGARLGIKVKAQWLCKKCTVDIRLFDARATLAELSIPLGPNGGRLVSIPASSVSSSTTTTEPPSGSTSTTGTTTSTTTPPAPVSCAAGDTTCELAAARTLWESGAGLTYDVKYTVSSEGGGATYCVHGVQGDPSSVQDRANDFWCKESSPNGVGVEAWFDQLDQWNAQGVLSEFSYDPDLGLPATVTVTGPDPQGITWRIILPHS